MVTLNNVESTVSVSICFTPNQIRIYQIYLVMILSVDEFNPQKGMIATAEEEDHIDPEPLPPGPRASTLSLWLWTDYLELSNGKMSTLSARMGSGTIGFMNLTPFSIPSSKPKLGIDGIMLSRSLSLGIVTVESFQTLYAFKPPPVHQDNRNPEDIVELVDIAKPSLPPQPQSK